MQSVCLNGTVCKIQNQNIDIQLSSMQLSNEQILAVRNNVKPYAKNSTFKQIQGADHK